MATSQAMDVIRCGLCKGKKLKLPAIQFSETCKLNLCEHCIGVHLTHSDDRTRGHNIVDIRYRKSASNPQNLKCENHEQDCVMFCNLCVRPVCPKCLESRAHGNHELVQVSSAVESALEQLNKGNQELEQCLMPAYEKVISDLRSGMALQKECHKENRDYIEKQGRRLRKELDEIIQNSLDKAKKSEKRDIEDFSNLISNMEGILANIKQTICFNRELERERDLNKLFKHENENEKFKIIPSTFEVTASSFSPGDIEKASLQKMFGTLTDSLKITKSPQRITLNNIPHQDKEHLKTPEVTKSWHTGEKMNVSPKVCCLNKSRSCFVRSGSRIKGFDETGKPLIEHHLKSHFLIDITVSKDNHLIYSDYREKCVNIIKGDKIETVINLNDWKPLAVCCSSSDDLLVTMQSDDEKKSKVCRFSGGSCKHEIQYRDDKEPLYSNPLFICENTNSDICVSDFEWNVVVVVDRTGGFLFNYTGSGAFRNREFRFRPRGLACDSLNHILVSDDLNNTIHIINRNGHFLQFIDNCDLQSPQDLSISEDDRLYVVVNHKDVLKVICYLT